jgi:hypothetical protein
MGLNELLDLKAQYERELMLAEAKVAVVNDIIAKAEAKEQTAEFCECVDTNYNTTEQSY